MVYFVFSNYAAHQWFGNLVTMDWWSDLWLNEGFASYITHMGADHVEPASKMLHKFISDELRVAMKLDSMKVTDPIYMDVESPDAIYSVFNEMTYSKGKSLPFFLWSPNVCVQCCSP